MSDRATPPPGSSPPPSSEELGVRAWCDLMDTTEQFLLAGLRRDIGPDGDLEAAHRTWLAERRKERDEALLRRATELARRLENVL